MEKEELLELAWGIIANVSNGNWDKQTEEWQKAAADWTKEYHSNLNNKK